MTQFRLLPLGQNRPRLAAARKGRARSAAHTRPLAGPSRGLAKLIAIALFALLLCPFTSAQTVEQPAIEPSPLVTRLLDDDLLTDAQRREVMIFHGQWEELENLTPQDHLVMMVARHEMPAHDDALAELLLQLGGKDGADVRSIVLLARMHVQGGVPRMALNTDIQDGQGTSPTALHLVHARALEDLGQYPQAIEKLAPIREQVQQDIESFTTAADLTAAAEAVLMLARLEGRPAADFHLANKLLSKAHEEIDPLYWPAYVAEAELLMAKGNPRQAMQAVVQALSLNPKSSEAWYLFGSMRCRFFDFEAAGKAVQELRKINPEHPLADALAVQVALRQKDVTTAESAITPALKRYPTHRKLLALNAAVQALAYDEAGTDTALEVFAKLAPGNPLAEHAVGQALSDARQYALAEPHLKRAIDMMPGWSEPQLTLGELYVQWGKLDQAATQLQTASSLDPFHKEITNQLTLVQEMLGYATIQTDQFVVRYLPGVDEVLARDVALHMGKMVDQFIERFQHDPPALTQVDLMPDDQHFAVRITGLPEIWTIAACTGDVIAMTPPRPGPKRAYGTYNWLNVMGHEYAHVVNLSQTNNRVPHWFTEGCAVQMETTGRLWSQYVLLSEMYNTGKLFTYDEINWGFIRPTEPYHRSLAYAQSAWIIEYLEQTHGWDKVLAMLGLYKQGVGEHDTIKQVFGIEVDKLMEGFMNWAGEQVEAWGMSTYGVETDDDMLARLLTPEGAKAADLDVLMKAAKEHPDRPRLLKYLTERLLLQQDREVAIELINQYRKVRPVDPWSDRNLAKLALEDGDAETAIASLKTLDKLEGDQPAYAVELSRVCRTRKDYEAALGYAERALLREPYNAIFRESAATIAIQHGDLARAAFHVESLELLEPKRAIHPKRLAVLYQRLEREEDAAAARERAKSLELLEND